MEYLSAPIIQSFTNPAIVAVEIVALAAAAYAVKLTIGSRDPPNLPPAVGSSIPFLGSALQFGVDPLALLREGKKKYGDCFHFKIFGEKIICLVGAEAHELFFKAGEDQLSANQAYQFTVPIFGKGIVYDCDPHMLLQQRKFIRVGLSNKRFSAYIPMIEKEAEDYFNERWKDEGEANLFMAISELIVLTSTRCLHGREIRENMHAEFAELYQKLDDALSPLGFFFPNLPLPAMIGRDKARKEFVKIFEKIIKKRRENPNVENEDMLQTFMEASYEDGKTLTDDEIVGMLIALMIAGQHTSKITGTWMGFYLIHHPELLKRACDEQKELLKDNTLDLEVLKKMHFMENCMREALRLRPPIILIMRRAVSDLSYKEYNIPKGSLVCVSPALTHRLPEYFKEPETFDPDRFGPGRMEHRQGAFQYLAFGAGAHACSGEAFAFVQVKTIWSYILRNFELSPGLSEIPEADFTTMIPGPKGPCTIKYRRRKLF